MKFIAALWSIMLRVSQHLLVPRFVGLTVSTATPLIPFIREVIAKEGSITLERYMEIVLQHPQHGYYRQGNPLGADGDFLTSPEASPMFGEMIGIWCVEAWKRLGSPETFVLLEMGPGQGTLLHTALQFTQHITDFRQALKLYLFESSLTLRQIQQERLAAYNPIHIDDLRDVPSLPTIVVANELFDTLPMRQFIRSYLGWYERMVEYKNGGLQFTKKYRIRLPKNITINPLARKTKRGCIYEASPQACLFMDMVANHIAQNTGAALIIDYGYVTPPENGTLDAWSQQHFVNVLSSPGKVDVTAGVDFAVLANVASKKGIVVADLITQREFLEQMGILSRAETLRTQADAAQKTSINRGLHYIASYEKMGKFRVLEFGRCPANPTGEVAV